MGNNTRIATLLNGAISLLAVVTITLVCIVPTAFAEDGANPSDAPGAGADNSVEQIAGPVPNIIITNFTYGDGSVAVSSSASASPALSRHVSKWYSPTSRPAISIPKPKPK